VRLQDHRAARGEGAFVVARDARSEERHLEQHVGVERGEHGLVGALADAPSELDVEVARRGTKLAKIEGHLVEHGDHAIGVLVPELRERRFEVAPVGDEVSGN
jgi:hypothetical protein